MVAVGQELWLPHGRTNTWTALLLLPEIGEDGHVCWRPTKPLGGPLRTPDQAKDRAESVVLAANWHRCTADWGHEYQHTGQPA